MNTTNTAVVTPLAQDEAQEQHAVFLRKCDEARKEINRLESLKQEQIQKVVDDYVHRISMFFDHMGKEEKSFFFRVFQWDANESCPDAIDLKAFLETKMVLQKEGTSDLFSCSMSKKELAFFNAIVTTNVSVFLFSFNKKLNLFGLHLDYKVEGEDITFELKLK